VLSVLEGGKVMAWEGMGVGEREVWRMEDDLERKHRKACV
jgi:hypothetical protein